MENDGVCTAACWQDFRVRVLAAGPHRRFQGLTHIRPARIAQAGVTGGRERGQLWGSVSGCGPPAAPWPGVHALGAVFTLGPTSGAQTWQEGRQAPEGGLRDIWARILGSPKRANSPPPLGPAVSFVPVGGAQWKTAQQEEVCVGVWGGVL